MFDRIELTASKKNVICKHSLKSSQGKNFARMRH